MSAISILDNQSGDFNVSMGFKDLPYQDPVFTQTFTALVESCFGASISIAYDNALTMLTATIQSSGEASRLAQCFDVIKQRIKRVGLENSIIPYLGQLRTIKTQRYVIIWERFITTWGDVCCVCKVLDRSCHERGVKNVVALSKGSLVCGDGERTHLEMLKRVHQRMKLTHKI